MFEHKILETDKVIIRIWTSRYNKVHLGENVGHVSIAIPSLTMNDLRHSNTEKTIPFYVSLWPNDDFKLGGGGMLTPKKHEFKLNYDEDLRAEGRAPELTICLYSLTTKSIQKEMAKICRGDNVKNKGGKHFKGWVLVGSNQLINFTSGESCASLAYKLLNAGGLGEAITSKNGSRMSSIVSPDALGEAVKKAKLYEQKRYPEVKTFNYDGETDLDEIKQTALCCLI